MRRKALGSGSARPASATASVVDDYTGLLDGNGRVARLARWLRDRPAAEGVDLLVLEVRGEEGYERVQSWPRASVTVALASVIDSLVVDAANEQGSYLTARAMWWDTAKAIAWATFALRVHPEGMGTQQAFSGDAQNINIQFQRNLDRASALHMQCIGETIAMHRDAQDDTRERAQRAERECDELRARLNESERARLDMERRVSELEDDLSAAMELAEESTKKVEETKQEADESSALTRMIAPMLGLAPPIKAS